MANNNLSVYELARVVPQEAIKPIIAGRLKGFSDINPMFRIKRLTEMFGPVGKGWYYTIVDERLEEGSEGQKVAFVRINLYVKYDNEWSMPIPGTGGSSFIAKESKGLYTSDECFKMALTDALSVSMKALGIGADVYWDKDRTKYNSQVENSQDKPQGNKPNKPESNTQLDNNSPVLKCSNEHGIDIEKKVYDFSVKKYGRPLCYDCQKKA